MRAKMNFVCKQVVKIRVGLYMEVIYIMCNCVYMTKIRMYNTRGPCVCHVRYSPVTTSHTRDLSRVVPRVIQREDKICHM